MNNHHRGEMISAKIKELGVPITKVAERLGINRKTLYNWMERHDLPLEYVIEIGKVINHDFRPELPEFSSAAEAESNYGTDWKTRYFMLLEENHEISKKHLALLDAKLKEFALSLVNAT